MAFPIGQANFPGMACPNGALGPERVLVPGAPWHRAVGLVCQEHPSVPSVSLTNTTCQENMPMLGKEAAEESETTKVWNVESIVQNQNSGLRFPLCSQLPACSWSDICDQNGCNGSYLPTAWSWNLSSFGFAMCFELIRWKVPASSGVLAG